MKYIEKYADTYQKIIDLKIDYKQFIRIFLHFVKSEVLPMSFYTNFYNELKPAFNIINDKKNNEKLHEFYLIAYKNIATHNENLEKNIARFIFNCLSETISLRSYIKKYQKSKLLGIKLEENTIINSIYILINILEKIEKKLSENYIIIY